jgi:hypothetical protein
VEVVFDFGNRLAALELFAPDRIGRRHHQINSLS